MLKNKSASIFLGLFLIFLFPTIMGTLLFHYHDFFKLKTLNHGNLISPTINLSNSNILNSQEKKWRVLYIYADNCDDFCKKKSYELQQIKKALDKDRNERIKIISMNENDLKINDLKKLFNKEFKLQNKIYLIDPNNNLFMYYESNENSMHILKDLKKVLEVSQIG